ncbi:MAG: DUF2141 domain-containing protein [Bacteroidota bacterium]
MNSHFFSKKLFLLIFCVPFGILAQNKLSVHVGNIPSEEGKVNVAVYNSESSFLKFEGVVKATSAPAHEGAISITLKDMPNGEYALAIFHDANGNDKLDTNWLGIPTEKVAFSKAKMKTFGPPKYHECRFKVAGDTEISVAF